MENVKKVEFNGPTQGVHIGDHYGDNFYRQNDHGYSAGVVKALEMLLEERELWRIRDLRDDRRTIEAAVTTEQVDTPEVGSAVRHVFSVGGALLTGVTGNSIYDALKHFLA